MIAKPTAPKRSANRLTTAIYAMRASSCWLVGLVSYSRYNITGSTEGWVCSGRKVEQRSDDDNLCASFAMCMLNVMRKGRLLLPKKIGFKCEKRQNELKEDE